MAHLWSGRFEGSPDAALFEFGASFRFDRRLFEDDVRGSIAWADAIHAAGVLSQQEAAAIKAALDEILIAGSDPAFFDSAAAKNDEDVHSFVERELVQRAGDAGRRLHTGRSRNEQVALDLRLYLKRRVCSTRRLPPAMRSCRPTRTCAARSRSWSRTSSSPTRRRCAATMRGSRSC
jgi:argininosuccinate lyase